MTHVRYPTRIQSKVSVLQNIVFVVNFPADWYWYAIVYQCDHESIRNASSFGSLCSGKRSY